MPIPTKHLALHLKRESAAVNLLGLLVRFKIHYEYDDYIDADISLVSISQIARFVRRMSKMNL